MVHFDIAEVSREGSDDRQGGGAVQGPDFVAESGYRGVRWASGDLGFF